MGWAAVAFLLAVWYTDDLIKKQDKKIEQLKDCIKKLENK